MSIPNSFILRPQRVWWRAALFQIHLWVGLILGVYVCIIGASGSVIVFEDDLTRLTRPELFRPLPEHEPALYESLPKIMADVRDHYPNYEPFAIFFPIDSEPALQFEGLLRTPGRQDEFLNVYVDPATGRVLGTTNHYFWLSRVRELHVRLLAGRTGLILNGCGGILLAALAGTGGVIWWRGIRRWRLALRVDVRRKWSRINFDLHSAIGVWLVVFVAMWAVSGIYFVWPNGFISMLDRLTPTRSALFPTVHTSPHFQGLLPIKNFIQKARSLNPECRLLEVELPKQNTDPFVVVVASGGDFRRATHLFFDPARGEILGSWTRGQITTMGAKSVPLLADLHFGEYWGLGIKVLWAALGLALPVLAITGALMYWNRFLAKKWRRILLQARANR